MFKREQVMNIENVVEFVGRNTAKRRKQQRISRFTENIYLANISSCHAGLLQGCYGTF